MAGRVLLTERERAVEFLGDLFALHPEGVERQQAIAHGRTVAISARTLQRAARDLGVITKHNGSRPGFWVPRS